MSTETEADGKAIQFQRKKLRPWDSIETLVPISNQKVTESEPNSNQLVTNKEPYKEPISNQLVTEKHIPSDDKVTQKEPISNPTSNRNKKPISNQLVIQLVTNTDAKTAIKRLYGLQRKILFYIVDHCVSEGHLISGAITNEALREITKTDADTIKTAVQRLIHKGLIQRIEGKRGKGGFASFGINKDIRSAVLDEKRNRDNSNQIGTLQVTDISNQLVTNKVSNKEPTVPSSSSNIYNKNTTTTELPPEWQEIDLSELHTRNIRLGVNHIIQYWDSLKNYSALEFQDSINGFIFDIDNGFFKIKTSPLNFLSGIFRDGKLYTPSANYKSPHIQQIDEHAARFKQRQEAAFYAWMEENYDQILKKIGEFDLRKQLDFKHNVPEVIEWVRVNIYLKKAIF